MIILTSRLPLIWSGANQRNVDAMAWPVSLHTFVCGSFPFLEVNAEPDLQDHGIVTMTEDCAIHLNGHSDYKGP